MNKKLRRQKVALTVERLRGVADFFESRIPQAIFSSQERRDLERCLREIQQAISNANSPNIWVPVPLVGDILKSLKTVFDHETTEER